MSDEKKESVGTNIWRYVAISALSVIAGLVTGQLNPSRQVVTVEQMNAALVPMQTAQTNELLEISSLRDRVNDLTGQLKAQHLLMGQ